MSCLVKTMPHTIVTTAPIDAIRVIKTVSVRIVFEFEVKTDTAGWDEIGGSEDGLADGIHVGDSVEITDGLQEGSVVRCEVGAIEGPQDGMTDGSVDGSSDGCTDGSIVGVTVGSVLGNREGSKEGSNEGLTQGNMEG